jgi:hypothetical protein
MSIYQFGVRGKFNRVGAFRLVRWLLRRRQGLNADESLLGSATRLQEYRPLRALTHYWEEKEATRGFWNVPRRSRIG